MQSTIYQIRQPHLRPLIQYILFNQAAENTAPTVITSLPNINICLGIVRGQALQKRDGRLQLSPHRHLAAYLSGLYTQPHAFHLQGALEEICIDFTPLGYYHFFKTPLQTYIFQDGLLEENFGKSASYFFEKIFSSNDLQWRGQQIEAFLTKQLQHRVHPHTCTFLQQLSALPPCHSVEEMARHLCCSVRSLQRHFTSLLDISPKKYLQIQQFRQLLSRLKRETSLPVWEQLAYQCGYYDYSHLTKTFKQLTHISPSEFLQVRQEIDQTVTVYRS